MNMILDTKMKCAFAVIGVCIICLNFYNPSSKANKILTKAKPDKI